MKVKIRSSTLGPQIIKVVYLGGLAGFHFGKVIEATARYVSHTGHPYPYPKWKYTEYRIQDEDGDSFTVSRDGVTFYSGFVPVPDEFQIGTLFKSRGS